MKLLLGVFVEVEQNSKEEGNPEIAYMLKDSSPSLKSPSKSFKVMLGIHLKFHSLCKNLHQETKRSGCNIISEASLF